MVIISNYKKEKPWVLSQGLFFLPYYAVADVVENHWRVGLCEPKRCEKCSRGICLFLVGVSDLRGVDQRHTLLMGLGLIVNRLQPLKGLHGEKFTVMRHFLSYPPFYLVSFRTCSALSFPPSFSSVQTSPSWHSASWYTIQELPHHRIQYQDHT